MSFAMAKHERRDQGTPIVFSVTPLLPQPGQVVSIEVDLSGVAEEDQVVDISTTTPGNWSNLPSQVTVPAGEDHVTFQAQVSSFAFGFIEGSASCNGGCASETLAVDPTGNLTPLVMLAARAPLAVKN